MRFYGLIGYVDTVETSPGVWEEQITERAYGGEVTRRSTRWQSGDKVNDNIDVNNTISIVADPYALEHFGSMRYVCWMNSKWKITSVDIQQPRLNITIGGVYNGPDES